MNSKKIQKLMKLKYNYPDPNDEQLQTKIYNKREFYYHRVPNRKILKNYEEVKEYRDEICGQKFHLYTQQSFLRNFVNPYTPYTGLLIFHGVGTGKTGGAISIAENFKETVQKYGTKVYILVSGPLIKEHWKDDILKFTGENMNDEIGYVDKNERNRNRKNQLANIMQYYKIISYRSFYKKVLGEKIVENRTVSKGKVKKTYRKTEEGEIERDLSVDRIENLDNTLLIVDEAHNLTDKGASLNNYGNAVKKIKKNSKNLRIILLTATPMKNFAEDIVELINYLRPENDRIHRNKIFTTHKNHLMDFRPGGKEYFQKMCNGYISHYRGANPLLFAKRVDIGEVPPGLIFTKVIRCKMLPFQKKGYIWAENNIPNDTLDRASQAVANFAFPGLTENRKSLETKYGKDGILTVLSQLKNYNSILLKKINKKFFNNKIKNIENILYENENTKGLSGLLFKEEYLKFFSIKFYTAFKHINNIVEGKNKKGSQTIFVYCNLVTAGVNVFKEILIQNGYLEYDEEKNYQINDNTIDYRTGLKYKDYIKQKTKISFFPAVFMTITGSNDELNDDVPDIKKKILDNVFNNIDNKDGKHIKIILGSRVMQEGITLENVGEVHILDVYYNFGRVHQVIGRAIRQCKHYKITSDKNQYPEVRIYKYVVSVDKGLSSEEKLYQKAEKKYLLIKKVERAMKEVAVDCAVNYHGNIFPEEIEKYKNCTIPLNKRIKNLDKMCPDRCDFMSCHYKCKDSSLNLKYYDKNSKIYMKIDKNKLDYNTFNNSLARNEIDHSKQKIKELYKYKYVYLLDEILEKVKNSYTLEQQDLFEPFFVYQALDELIPISENEHNNFKDSIYDKYSIPGYLIYRHKYYIFQPFNQNENVPMYYRSNYQKDFLNDLSLYNYLDNKGTLNTVKMLKNDDTNQNTNKKKVKKYNFSNIKSYYDYKEDYDHVGIIARPSSKRTTNEENIKDVFKIRINRKKILEKKRGTGIPSEKGAVCNTSKSKEELIEIAKSINVDKKKYNINDTRISICNSIKIKLLYLEKYSTKKDKNKYTYIIIPNNHPIYQFPFNLEDRLQFVKKTISEKIPLTLKFVVKKKGNGIFEGIRKEKYPIYIINLKNTKQLEKYVKILVKNKFQLINNTWEIILE
jgi:hypothetical protein